MNENKNPLATRKGTETLDLDDRRRLAFAELQMIAEVQGGPFSQIQYGQCILHNLPEKATEEDLYELGAALVRRITEFQIRGY